MTVHHATITNSKATWGRFHPALISSKPSSDGQSGWLIEEKNNSLLKGLPADCDRGSIWLQSNSRICPHGWIDVPVSFVDGSPLAAVRWDLPGLLVSLGFNLEDGS